MLVSCAQKFLCGGVGVEAEHLVTIARFSWPAPECWRSKSCCRMSIGACPSL